MEAKVTESQAYRNAGERAGEILHSYDSVLTPEQKEYFLRLRKRVENHRKLEQATGIKIAVASDTEPHVAAFITTADKKIHMVDHTLDDYTWALYAANHEKMHEQTSAFFDLSYTFKLEESKYDALEEQLNAVDVDIQTDWIEGFTDLATKLKHGKHENSGYNHVEVPAAEKLEKLCLEKTGVSLLDAFTSNNIHLFYSRLEKLSTALLLEKTYENMLQENPKEEGYLKDMKPDFMKRLKEVQPPADNEEEAEKVAVKILFEAEQLRRLGGIKQQADYREKTPAEVTAQGLSFN